MDTIFALATARGKSGVAVVRVSGPQAWRAAERLAGSLPAARSTAVRRLRDRAGEVLDQALVLPFRAGHSSTGEDVVELHLHGSMAVAAAVLQELAAMPGLRQAEAGEFSRCALENDRLNISQIEGLGDLIDAETAAQRRQAMRVFSGRLGERVEAWRGKLVRAAALLEATIDFVDEDVPVDVRPEVDALLENVGRDLAGEIAGVGIAERIRDGFEVAIVGAPNAGKSTLLNYLAQRDAAITSDIAGTTRDVIEVRMDLEGLAVTLLDTAGLREGRDEIERVGIERTRRRASEADLRVFLVDASPEELGIVPLEDDIVVRAKGDLHPDEGCSVSGKTGAGVRELLRRIADVLAGRAAGVGTATHLRHKTAMQQAVNELAQARAELEHGEARVDLAAAQLRAAVASLDSLVGRIDVEQVLDEIFARFCIGK